MSTEPQSAKIRRLLTFSGAVLWIVALLMVNARGGPDATYATWLSVWGFLVGAAIGLGFGGGCVPKK